jgi:hypothetical protein
VSSLSKHAESRAPPGHLSSTSVSISHACMHLAGVGFESNLAGTQCQLFQEFGNGTILSTTVSGSKTVFLRRGGYKYNCSLNNWPLPVP